MSATIDQITERLNPQVLADQTKEVVQEAAREKVEQAKGAVREATIGKVEGAVSSVTGKVQEAMGSAGDAVSGAAERVQQAVGIGQSSQGTNQPTYYQDSSGGVLQTLRRHPLPTAMTAAGLTWLFMSARSERGKSSVQAYQIPGTTGYTAVPPTGYYAAPPNYGYQAGSGRYQSGGTSSQESGSSNQGNGQGLKAIPDAAGQALKAVPDTVGQVAGKAQESVSQLGSQATNQARRARGGFERVLEDNPLAVGVVAVGVGVLAGLAVPETDKENELLGQARESLMDKASQFTQDTTQRVQSVAQEAVDAAKQEARNQHLAPEA